MRRVPAILLIFVFSFTLMAPALWADAAADLPACCRRDGKHHCAMSDPQMAPSSDRAFAAQRMRCPLFPHSRAILPHAGTALLASLQSAHIALERSGDIPVTSGSFSRRIFDPTYPKRGPPALL